MAETKKSIRRANLAATEEQIKWVAGGGQGGHKRRNFVFYCALGVDKRVQLLLIKCFKIKLDTLANLAKLRFFNIDLDMVY